MSLPPRQVARAYTACLTFLACVVAGVAGAHAGDPVQMNNVAAGSATFEKTANTTTITASNGAIINYDKFNVPTGHTVEFVQPNAASRVLNRITGPDPSVINGTLKANGQVYLVNPAGITFGAGSVVDVGRLYAAAGNITDTDFLNNIDRFSTSGAALVANGDIRSKNGVFLMARQLINTGSIISEAGVVSLASGDEVYLADVDTQNVTIRVDNMDALTGKGASTPVTVPGAVGIDNSGSVSADTVVFSSGDVYSLALVNSGDVDATSRVAMTAHGKVEHSGTITAGSGSKVDVLGHEAIFSGDIVAPDGQVETSGWSTINFDGGLVIADHWLIDPTDVTVDAGSVGAIVGSLNAGTDVTLDTTSGGGDPGDITVNVDINKTAGGDATLTFDADRHAIINADITSTSGALDVVFDVDGLVLLGADISTNGGDVTFQNTAWLTAHSNISTGAGGGNIDFQSGLNGTYNLGLTAGTGNITIGSIGQGVIHDANLVAWWQFDEGNGTSLTDSSGNGYTATAQNGPTWDDGILGGSLDFDGGNDHATVSHASALEPLSSNWTVSAWIKTASDGTILAKGTSDRIVLSVTGGKARFLFDNGNNNPFATSTTTVTDGQWHLVTGTRTGVRTANIYVDGVLEGTQVIGSGNTAVNTTATLQIGRNGSSADYFDGNLDDIQYHNAALSSSQVAELYAAGVQANTHGTRVGNLTIQSAGNVTTGAITANSVTQLSGVGNTTIGGNLSTTGMAGNAGGNVAITTNGSITINGAINTSGGTATAGGLNAGNVTLRGGDVTTDNITATGSDAAGGGPSNGGNGGDITITATDGTPTITIDGNLLGTGGSGNGSGAAGADGDIALNTTQRRGVITVDAGASNLTLEQDITIGGRGDADVTFGGAAIDLGATITTNGGDITFDHAVTLTAHSTLDTGALAVGDVTFNSTLEGSYDLTIIAGAGGVAFGGDVGQPLVPGSLAAHWKLDESVAGPVVDELGGYGGTNTGATINQAGQDGQAYDFGAGNNYVDVTNLDDLLDDTASMTFWIRTSATGNNTMWAAPGVAGVEQAGGSNDIFWGWIDGSGRIGMTKGNGAHAKSTNAINDNTWHHIGLTYNSGTGRTEVYVNGTLNQGVTSASGVVTNSFSRLGSIQDTGGSPTYLNALLDDVRIYNTVLDSGTIGTLYNQAVNGAPGLGRVSILANGPITFSGAFASSSYRTQQAPSILSTMVPRMLASLANQVQAPPTPVAEIRIAEPDAGESVAFSSSTFEGLDSIVRHVSIQSAAVPTVVSSAFATAHPNARVTAIQAVWVGGKLVNYTFTFINADGQEEQVVVGLDGKAG